MPLPIHFFTIVLNGQPFIRYHLDRMRALTVPWHWHIVEGLADLKHDTSWSVHYGAKLPTDVVQSGRSVDGTSEYLDQIAREHPGQITIYRAPNERVWDGKLEMVAAPLANIQEECLLWEIDADELWTTDQFHTMHQLFSKNPERKAAIFFCHYFVGPNRVINRLRRYAEIEWRRAWRFKPGMRWLAHEPPVLAEPRPNSNKWVDVATMKPFWPFELEAHGLVFQHFAYVTPEQLEFKERYYGYKNIFQDWQRLQQHDTFPVRLREFFDWPWVHPDALVEPPQAIGLAPLARLDGKEWQFRNANDVKVLAPKRGVVYIKWGPDTGASHQRSIESVRAIHPELPIHTHQLPDNATLLDKAAMHRITPFDETLFLDIDTVVLDRLDFGFTMAQRHRLACCICENPWARRYGGLAGDMVEYNTGVLFFTRQATPIFEAWMQHVRSVDSSIQFIRGNQIETMPYNDQAGFALAVAASERQPYILPLNWNLRPLMQRTWWGPIKIWHDYRPVPTEIIEWNKKQTDSAAIIQYAQIGG
ncbi:MAG: hypothetical protein ABL921_00055 [Pirellula sp.]